jgi:hypothetical protein
MTDKKKKVVDLHPDKPTPRKVLEDLLDRVEEIDSVVVLVRQTDGGVVAEASYMSLEDRALLTKLNEFEMFQAIMFSMESQDDDDGGNEGS